VLDEPASAQSDATIVDMKLRQLSNVVSKPEDAPVKKLDRADKNHQHIDNWIRDIKVGFKLLLLKMLLRNYGNLDLPIVLLILVKCLI
jgi:hypothetical protein